MNIQIISEYFYPDDFNINAITAELVRRGHQVNILTGLPDYSDGKVPKEYRFFRKRCESFSGAGIRRIPIIARRNGAFMRALSYFTFMVNSSLYALFCRKPECDTIFVNETSPIFQVLPGIILKKRTGKPLVMYCYDLWPESLKAWGMKESNIIFRIIKAFSGWLCRSCDIIAITSRPFREYLLTQCGVPDDRIVYLPQACEDLYSDIAGEYEDNDCFDFVFAGNIGSVQNIECILEAASKTAKVLNQDELFRIHIVGDGSELDSCKALATELDIHHYVVFHGRHPLREMPRFYRMADAFLLTLRGDTNIGMTLPGKVQGYLCAGKPVLAAIDGAARDLIHEADCGDAVRAGDSDGLAGCMVNMIRSPELYREKGENGRRFYERNFTMEHFMESLEELL